MKTKLLINDEIEKLKFSNFEFIKIYLKIFVFFFKKVDICINCDKFNRWIMNFNFNYKNKKLISLNKLIIIVKKITKKIYFKF